MHHRKRLVVIVLCILVFASIALLGGLLGKKTGKVSKKEGTEQPQRCAYDGTKINAIYQVDAYLSDGMVLSFCSIYCATQWLKNNRDKAIYFTVIDEVTGQRFDSSLAHFVESDVVTVREVKNRIHSFYIKDDALKHAKQFNGKMIENPFGTAFVLPKVAQFDKFVIGVPDLPDALPMKLALFRPIFKENRLDVHLVPFQGEEQAQRLLSNGSVVGLICDLPRALVFAKSTPPTRIIKNVLRANPYRPLFALVARTGLGYEDFMAMEGTRHIAVPKGLSFEFYADYYIKTLDLPPDKVALHWVEDTASAWEVLQTGSVSAALLRTPYTDIAMQNQMALLADDRSLPWMSVLVVHTSVVDEKTEIVKRFLFGLEQSVLALNLKPDEFHPLLQEQGGIPQGARKKFPMPIFEGANCPAPDEISTIMDWLDSRGVLSRDTPYEALINPKVLPNPDDVGLAFCCR